MNRPTADLARAAFSDARSRVALHPQLYPLAFVPRRVLKGQRTDDVDGDTELFMDGFPSSGNSFAMTVFRDAQGRERRVAGHNHAPGQLIRAVGLGVPSLIFIRPPEGSVLSLCSRWPAVPVRQSLARYVRFYRVLSLYAVGFVVATFDQVTTDFGRVVDRVNDRFDTDFDRFDHTPESAARYYRPDPDSPERRTRRRRKEALAVAYHDPDLAGLRRAADSLYQLFEAGARLSR